jgi:hypothetical protein
MARAWEADFIRLWEAGATQAAIAQALGCPLGTAAFASTHGGPGGPASRGR